MRALPFLLAAACVSHIAPYKPKERHYDRGIYASNGQAHGPSLYTEGNRGLFEDDRASRVGDIIIIKIEETDAGSHEASSKLAKDGKNDYSAAATLGLLPALQKAYPALDPSQLLSTASKTSFDGSGTVTRSGKLSGTLPVRVRDVMPNSDLYVEGTKVVLVGEEEHHLYVSGIIRQADIRADGTVLSSQVADAEIEYTGRGDVTDQQRPGWLTRLVGNLWPF